MLFSKEICVLAALVAAACTSVQGQGQWSWAKYGDVKDDIKFPKYTPEERTLVAKQAQAILDVYVNRESKLANYGTDVDPLPRIADLVAQAPSMSDSAFHLTLANIFLNLRDFHTNYFLPGPYSCYRAVYPIEFTLIDSDDLANNPQVAVKALSSFPEVLEMAPDVAKKVRRGDVLLKMNGKTFGELYNEFQNITGGANKFGGHRSALGFISFRSGRLFPLPEETEVTYEFRRGNYVYTVKAPLAARINDPCLASSLPPAAGRLPPSPEPEIPIKEQLRTFSPHPFLDEMKEVFETNQDYPLNPTAEDILSWGTYNRGPTKLGIIRLESFSPAKVGSEGTIQLIRNLLVNELKDTDALVFDIRDNGGGLIDLADGIPQFFVSNFQPTGARALVSKVNEQVFNSASFQGTSWQAAYNATLGTNKTYTPIVQFVSNEAANIYGQAYFKPVAVWNNGNCYSACDLFSANIQDSGAGVVIGEDPQSGAGGANVVQHRSFFVKTLPEVFEGLPGGQDMRVGWRQTVRTGKNQGALIEDTGVIADHVFRPRPVDLKPNRTQVNQLDKIAFVLKMKGRRSGSAFRSFLDSDGAMNIIALSLRSPSPRTRALVLEIFGAVCLIPGGHRCVLEGMDALCETAGMRFRFETVVYSLWSSCQGMGPSDKELQVP
ncbi:hypothetical protein HK102_005071, partial [Quaeritorhiza haematococci]